MAAKPSDQTPRTPQRMTPQNPEELPTIQLNIEDGQVAEGKLLEDFLKTLEDQEPFQPTVTSNPQLENSGNSLEKSAAATQTCMVDFDSRTGLRNIPHHAHAYYTLRPWYYEPCGNSYTARVLPTGSSSNAYYLTPEYEGTNHYCPSGDHDFGFRDGFDCVGPFIDAATVHRVAGNGTSTEGQLGLRVLMYKGTSRVNFDLDRIRLLQGKIRVWGAQSGKWRTWDLKIRANYYFSSSAHNLSQVVIHDLNLNAQYVVDDIRIISVN